MALTINVNGKAREVRGSADMPLLWALRDDLGLVGTKYGCGAGLCGACTVIIDGEAVRSCQTPVRTIGAKKITTIEGLAANASHPLQKAWIEESVSQCGYCQAGQIMAAAAMLMKKSAPTDADIDAAMAGNLCPCGTYQRIRKAIHRAASGERS